MDNSAFVKCFSLDLSNNLTKDFLHFGVRTTNYKNSKYVVIEFLKSSDLDQFISLNKIYENKKYIFVLPFEEFYQKSFDFFLTKPNISIVYTQFVKTPKDELRVGIGEVFYFSSAKSASRLVTRWLLSFNPPSREVFILGSQTSSTQVWKEFKKYMPDLSLSYDKNKQVIVIPRNLYKARVKSNLKKLVKKLFTNTKINSPKLKEKKYIKIPKLKINLPRINLKKYKKFIFLASVLILTPFVLVILICGLFYLSFKSFVTGKTDIANKYLYLSKTISYAGALSFGHVNKDLKYFFDISYEISDSGKDVYTLAKESSLLFTKILGDEIYDPKNIADNLFTSLKRLEEKLLIIKDITLTSEKKNSYLAKYVGKKVDFDKFYELAMGASKISDNLPSILGKEGRKTYLLLFQNNMELRPTGGFIGSFGLMTLDNGRMTDLSVSDVYSADGQLKGHVEPPKPIRDYLGEGNWYLRDSNWDPDFVVSAKKAEWFLDKEIDKKVDGVVAIDLNVARDLLKYTGPIYLADYGMDITTDNLYLKTQEEVHEEFFPGTHKKASFLTALSRNLVTEAGKLSMRNKIGVMRELYDNLEGRHIQIFLHDDNAQEIFRGLGWSGEIVLPQCGEGCYPDYIVVTEANLGVNKANYFIKRNYNVKTEIRDGKIFTNFILTLKNDANPSLGLAGKYKAYIRILLPRGSEINGDYVISDTDKGVEIGFLEEIINGETKKINLSWSQAVPDLDSYGIYVRKQAGTDDADGLKLSILANGENYSYNSQLDKDFIKKITW